MWSFGRTITLVVVMANYLGGVVVEEQTLDMAEDSYRWARLN